MSITLIGGMDRLRPEYKAAAKAYGCELKCVPRNECNFHEKVGKPDMLIVFTNKISHEARRKVVEISQSRGIPLQLRHSCGVSTLKECLKNRQGNQ